VKGSEESESNTVKGSEESESTTVKDSEDSESTKVKGSEESESTTVKDSEDSESTKVKGSEESESTTVKDSEDSEFTPLEGSEESESKATLGGSEESESSTLRGWWTTTPRPEHKGHGAAWWPPTHGPSTTSTAASTSSTARNSTSTSSSRRSTTSTSAEPTSTSAKPTSTSAKPTSTSATPKKTTATSITTPSTCPMVSFYGSPQARCFCQLARNPGCPGCSCPQGCQQVTWDHPRSVTFKNIRQASHCWGQSTVGLLTIPRSYFRDLKVLSDKCNAGMAGLLAEMLRDAFATYQQNFGHGRVMQCIHSPGHISTPWLHLHTFCEHGVMDAMPLAPAKANPVAWCGDMGSPDEAEVMAREVVAWASSHCSGCMV